jgi:hypothetical protein
MSSVIFKRFQFLLDLRNEFVGRFHLACIELVTADKFMRESSLPWVR